MKALESANENHKNLLKQVGLTGLELPQKTPIKRESSAERSRIVATARTEGIENNPLTTWLDGCPVELDEATKAAILDVMRTAGWSVATMRGNSQSTT